MNTNTANTRQSRLWAVVLASLLVLPAIQASQAGTSLPWEAPLLKLAGSLQGPVAYSLCIIAIVASGFTLWFGGEINDIMKWFLRFILVAAIVLGATGAITSFFGITGAVL